MRSARKMEVEKVSHTTKRAKRALENSLSPETSTPVIEETEDDDESLITVNEVRHYHKELIDYIEKDMDPGRRLPKTSLAILKEKITSWALSQAAMAGAFTTIAKENLALKAELHAVKESNLQLKTKKEHQAMSYASAASKPALNKTSANQGLEEIHNQIKQRKTATLFITKEGKDGKKVQQEFTRICKPIQNKIKIVAMRTTAKTLIVETSTEVDSAKILNDQQITNEFKCERTRKRRPMVIIYDVPAELQEEELMNTIYRQNYEDTMTRDQFNTNIKPRFKTGPKNKSVLNYVMEIDPNMRKDLIQQGRLFIGYRAVKVKDYIVVPLCTKCQDLGHATKFCPKTKNICAQCGNEGHLRKDCQHKDKINCIPCTNRRRTCDGHDCKTYKQLLDKMIQRIDYGL